MAVFWYQIRRDPDHGVPRRAILLSFSIIVVMGLFDFDTILGVDNFLSALASLVEMCAAVKMRFSHPEIERPYKGSNHHVVPNGARPTYASRR